MSSVSVAVPGRLDAGTDRTQRPRK